MQKFRKFRLVILTLTVVAVQLFPVLGPATAADSAPPPQLVISQLKVTSSNGQFVTVYNATNQVIDMSNYQLEYFNSYDITKATSSKLISLNGTVAAHGYYMVNDGTVPLCYKLTLNSVSLGFSSTAGLVELLGATQSGSGNSVSTSLQDYVGWSKVPANGAQTLPTASNGFLERQPVDVKNNPSIISPGIGSWQPVMPDSANACGLVTANNASGSMAATVQTGLSQLLAGSEPPATIVNTGSDVTPSPATTASLPATDVGLMAPEVTELLPNPAGTGNDATNEYIELYNSNNVSFDLSGFSLQAGTTVLHTFTFPGGVSLPAKGFTAFYSKDTGLSLSNSGGQVKLLDPFGNSLSVSQVYGTANDGQAWALASGNWYWTTRLTPGAPNIIDQPITTTARKTAISTSATKTKSTKTSKTVTNSKTKAAKTKKVKAVKPKASTSNSASDTALVTPIHPWILALVAGLALLYGAYEYRTDLANYIYKLRKHLGRRRPDRT